MENYDNNNYENDFKNILSPGVSLGDKSYSSLRIGKYLYTRGIFDLAKIFIEIAGESGNQTTLAEAEFYKGIIYSDLHDFKRASEHFEGARDKAMGLKQNSLVDEIDLAMGSLLERAGNTEKAKEHLEKLVEKTIKAWKDVNAIKVLNLLAQLQKESGNPIIAWRLLKQAYKLGKSQDNPSLNLMTNTNLLNLEIELGNYRRAQDLAEATLDIAKSLEKKEVIAITYSKMAEIHLKTGEYGKAIRFARKARELLPSFVPESLSADIEWQYWKCQWNLTQYGIALDEINRLFKRSKNEGRNTASIKILETLINMYLFLGSYNKAEKLLYLLSHLTFEHQKNAYIQYFLKGKYNIEIGKWDEALKNFDNAITTAEIHKINPYVIESSLYKAEILLKRGEIDHALMILNEKEKETAEQGDFLHISKLHLLLSKINQMNDGLQKAKAEIQNALRYPHFETREEILFEAYMISKKLREDEKAKEYIFELGKLLQAELNSLLKKDDRERFIQTDDRKVIVGTIAKERELQVNRKGATGKQADKSSEDTANFKIDDEYISTVDAEKMFHISRITIFRWIKDRKLPAIKLKNGRYKIRLSDIEEFISKPKTSKKLTFLPLDKYIKQEEKRYLTVVLNTVEDKKVVSAVLGLPQNVLQKKLTQHNL